MVAQVAALDHQSAFSALTLVGTRPVAPGNPDPDLPDHDQATMRRLFALPMPDWTDREAVADFAAARAQIRGDDPVTARVLAARIRDRTPSTAPAVQMTNQLGMALAKLNCKPRWRERLPEIDIPTLVVHGSRHSSRSPSHRGRSGDPIGRGPDRRTRRARPPERERPQGKSDGTKMSIAASLELLAQLRVVRRGLERLYPNNPIGDVNSCIP